MDLSKNQIILKLGKKGGHCNWNTLLPYERKITGFSCGYNVIRRRHERIIISSKKKHFINILKNAEQGN